MSGGASADPHMHRFKVAGDKHREAELKGVQRSLCTWGFRGSRWSGILSDSAAWAGI